MTDPPRLSVVVCTFDRHDRLARALASIERQTLAADAFELVVVDNAPGADGREAVAAASTLRCRTTVLVEQRPGVSRARNIGARRARAPVVAFLDDDAVADPDWAGAVVDRFERVPDLGILGGPVEPIWRGPVPAWLHPAMNGYLTIVDHGSEPRALGPCEWLAATNMAFDRAALLDAGGFDETLGRKGRVLLSHGEVALTHELIERGFTAFYDPLMRVRHEVHPHRVSRAWMRERSAWQIVSETIARPDDSPPPRPRDIGTIMGFLAQLAPRDRGPQGLFADLDDPDLALRQLAAVEAFVRLLLRNAADWRSVVDLGD